MGPQFGASTLNGGTMSAAQAQDFARRAKQASDTSVAIEFLAKAVEELARSINDSSVTKLKPRKGASL